MRRLNMTIWPAVLVAALIITGIGACVSGGGDPLDLRADSFLGAAPENFTGPDADNTDARSEAADMATGRSFDFTPSGFTLNSGPVNSDPADGSDYGVSGGSLAVDGDEATVELDILSTNPDVTNASMSGTFSLGAAQSAILNPGRSFTVVWDVAFDYLGLPIALTMEQELTGQDFEEL